MYYPSFSTQSPFGGAQVLVAIDNWTHVFVGQRRAKGLAVPLATHVQVTAGPPIFLRLEKGSGCILRWHEKGSNSIGTSVGSQRNNS